MTTTIGIILAIAGIIWAIWLASGWAARCMTWRLDRRRSGRASGESAMRKNPPKPKYCKGCGIALNPMKRRNKHIREFCSAQCHTAWCLSRQGMKALKDVEL